MDALELSMDDSLVIKRNRETKQAGSFSGPLENRGLIKNQIEQALRSSNLGFESLLGGKAVRRSTFSIDSTQFSVSPVMSLLQAS